MPENRVNIVTGAFGFTGSYITRRLLAMGEQVRTLTAHPERHNEFGEAVQVMPYNFSNPGQLAESMKGASVLYNTYWIRFARGEQTFEQAVENSKTLITAAEDAGVERIVHVSITNPSHDSALPYFKGKAEVEDAIKASKLSYAILRPAVIFGDQGILINNIAFFLRRLPAFAVPGSGDYELQPIFVDDLAALAVEQGHKSENVTVDAIGPETYKFYDLVKRIEESISSGSIVMRVPPALALLGTKWLGLLVNDVVLTSDEIRGLEQNLLVTESEPTGSTRLSEWLDDNADWLGTRYFSELKKHF